jgi:hypothetical protein
MVRAAKASGGCPSGTFINLTWPGLLSAPRRVLMRRMTSCVVVLSLLTGQYLS